MNTCADLSDSNLGIVMINPMDTIVVMKEKLETEVPLPEPLYQNWPMMLLIIGAIFLTCAFYLNYFLQYYWWALLAFGGGTVSCMYGAGLFMYRKGVRKPS